MWRLNIAFKRRLYIVDENFFLSSFRIIDNASVCDVGCKINSGEANVSLFTNGSFC